MIPGKVAENETGAQGMMDKFKGIPHAHLDENSIISQLYLECRCGLRSSFRHEIPGNFQCPACGTVYALNPHIEVIEVKHPTVGSGEAWAS